MPARKRSEPAKSKRRTSREPKQRGSTTVRTPRARAMAAAPTVDAYMAGLRDEQRRELGKIRRLIKAAAPEAVESISYAIPTYKVDGQRLAYFAAFENHMSLYALPTKSMPADAKRHLASKGTIRFTPEDPLPSALVTKLVKARLADIKAGRSRS